LLTADAISARGRGALFWGFMETFFATLVIFLAIVGAMAIGVVFTGRSLRGSCGGTGEGCECSEERRQACASKHEEAREGSAS